MIVAEVPDPDEKMRYGIAAVMLGGRYALHLRVEEAHRPVPGPTLDQPLESRVAPYRAEKDSVVFPHSGPIPYELIADVTRAIVAERARLSPEATDSAPARRARGAAPARRPSGPRT